MAFLASFGIAGKVIFILVTFLWVLSLTFENAGIVDIYWGLGFVICCWIYFPLCSDGYLPRKMLLGAFVTVRGLRLSLRYHLHFEIFQRYSERAFRLHQQTDSLRRQS